MTSNVESFYPLSPMQEGMLFHTLEAPGSGIYVTQMTVALRGDLDAEAFRRAWRLVLDRHPILRTFFVWEEIKRPVQVVERQVDPPLELQDWRGLPPREVEERLAAFLEAERARGFDLTVAPLMRLALIREGERLHQFVWTFHHILLDAWSASLVVEEVVLSYTAFSSGISPELPRRRPFRDYIVWLERQDLRAAEAFWKGMLAGFSAPTPLMLDAPASPSGGEALFGLERTRLTAAGTAALQGWARREGVTLNSLVQGSWALLLSRYSGEPAVAFGFASSGRPADLAGSESMVGLFVNTLVLRLRVPAAAAPAAWLREVQDLQAAARQYEYSPLAQIQGWSRVPKSLPLFESAIDFENYLERATGARTGGLEIGPVQGEEQSNVPMVLEVRPGRELSLQIRYDRRRFSAPAVRRLLGHLEVLLSAWPSTVRGLADLPMLTEAERHQLLVAWNDTESRPLPTLPERFSWWASREPSLPALRFGDRRMSYGELEASANRLARYLRRQGVGPESLVGLSMERSPELIVALLGIFKAGAAYLPLDPGYPPARLAYMLEDSGVELLLTGPGSPALAGVRRLDVESEREAIEGESGAPLAGSFSPESLAYVIYTSGSTGRPKGVMVGHRGLANLAEAQVAPFGAGPGKRVLQFAPLSFDASIFEIAMAFGVGAALVLARQEALVPGPEFLGLLRDQGVTHVTLPPSALAALPESELPELETIVCAGEALPESLVERWGGSRRLLNAYGPTESTVWATVSLCHPGWGKPDIGRAISGARVLLLDTGLRAVPQGASGEVFLGGVGLARGYLGRPDLTAERFVPDPWSRESGGRLYRTGDLGRWLPDGRLDFLGRADHQVKIRGFRIEIGEVEAALGTHPELREAAVVAHEDEQGKSLVAYVVARREPGPTVTDLRRYLKERLPEHMVPSSFQVLAELPHSPSGKVDRAALPAPGQERPALAEAFVLPRSEAERLLAQVWCEVLGLDQVGVHDDFFELGGDSILTIQVTSRVRRLFGVELPLRSLFESPTVSGLAGKVQRALLEKSGVADLTIEPAPRDGEIPLSFAQQRLWFLSVLEPESPAYNEHTGLRFNGPLDVVALGRCLDEIVRRHEILRTTFPVAEGVARQLIAPVAAPRGLPLADLGSLPGPVREAELGRLALDGAHRPFDLERGPLLRVFLVRLGAEAHAVLLSMHHIVGDAWSMRVLVRELTALYPAFHAGQPSPLPELPIQYADFAVWQRRWLQGETLEAQLRYWRERLADAPALLHLPADRPRPAVQTYRGGQRSLWVSGELLAAAGDLVRGEGITLFMLLLAVLETLLHRYTGQTAITLGTPVAGRSREETEPLIGCFVNTLVLRGDLEGGLPFRDLLARVRDRALEDYAHQDLPFEILVEHLQPDRSLAHTPLFQVMFNLAPRESLQLSGLELESLEVEAGTAKFDLELQTAVLPDGLIGALEYNLDLFDPATAERMLGHFRRLLEGAVRDPDLPLAELPVLTPPEQHQIQAGWNDTVQPFPLERCFHELFAEQAARTPDRIAAACGGEELTYRELNRRANRGAWRLIERGIGTGDVVALLAPRGLDLLAAILAVFKAGGVYLPLDEHHPPNRVRQILERSRARLILAAGPTPEGEPEVLDIEPLLAGAGREDEPPARSVPADLAYIIFTSGSTGTPKGAMVTHEGMLNHLFAKVVDLGLTADDCVAQNASQCFDISIWQLFAGLLTGGCTRIFGEEAVQDPRRLLEEVDANGVSILELVPSVLQVALEHLGGRGRSRLRSLRWLLATGEALPPELARRWTAAFPGIPLLNAYGPTECSDDVSHHVLREVLREAPQVPIGRPVANTRLYVLDPGLRPVPAGVTGELAVGGTGVGRGYVGEAARTAEVFIPDPFAARPGSRLYRTGDLARWLPAGEIEFLGRIDHQVKIRGFRIELAEIETVLARHPAVREVVVTASRDSSGESRLVAYIVPSGPEAPSARELSAFVQEVLPDYMTPAAFVVLPGLPLTANGKVDRKALPAPEGEAAADRIEVVAPRDETERKLARIWEDLLPGREIGIHQDFFAAGGHSLLAVRLMARIESLFGKALPLATLLRETTIARLAALLRDDDGDGGAASPLVPIQVPSSVTDRRPPLFCVHPIGGGVLCYRDLAGHLDPDQPLYGLQAPDLVQAGEEDVSIAAMAARYLEALRQVQPRGPYLLAGWSFGGVVAFEMAVQLRRRGEDAMVILFDTWAPAAARRLAAADDATLLTELIRDHASQAGREIRLDPGPLRHLPPERQLEEILALIQEAGLAPADLGVSWLRAFLRGYKRRARALQAYEPGVLDGRVVLLRASEIRPEAARHLSDRGIDPDEPTHGWKGLATEPVEVHPVPGSHETLLAPPHVEAVAARLRTLIDNLGELPARTAGAFRDSLLAGDVTP